MHKYLLRHSRFSLSERKFSFTEFFFLYSSFYYQMCAHYALPCRCPAHFCALWSAASFNALGCGWSTIAHRWLRKSDSVPSAASDEAQQKCGIHGVPGMAGTNIVRQEASSEPLIGIKMLRVPFMRKLVFLAHLK